VQSFSWPDTHIITGAASITSQNRASNPPRGSVGISVELHSTMLAACLFGDDDCAL
jgi:hypothetical protein